MLIDPDGRKILFAEGCSDAFKQKYSEAIQTLNAANVGYIFAALESSDYTYYICDGSHRPLGKGSGFNAKTMTITWIPDQCLYTEEGNTLSSFTILNHEGGHALDYDNALKEGKTTEYFANQEEGSDPQYGTINERHVITTYEQQTAEALNEVSPGVATRTSHGGTPIVSLPEMVVTSNNLNTSNL